MKNICAKSRKEVSDPHLSKQVQRAKSVLKSLRLPFTRQLAATQQLWSPPTHSRSFTRAPQREITGGQKQVHPDGVILRACGALNQWGGVQGGPQEARRQRFSVSLKR